MSFTVTVSSGGAEQSGAEAFRLVSGLGSGYLLRLLRSSDTRHGISVLALEGYTALTLRMLHQRDTHYTPRDWHWRSTESLPIPGGHRLPGLEVREGGCLEGYVGKYVGGMRYGVGGHILHFTFSATLIILPLTKPQSQPYGTPAFLGRGIG